MALIVRRRGSAPTRAPALGALSLGALSLGALLAGSLCLGGCISWFETVTIAADSTLLYVGQTEKLTATVLPDNVMSKEVTWTSSAPDVASVAADGTVTAQSVGTATITATSVVGKKASSLSLTIDGLVLNRTDFTGTPGTDSTSLCAVLHRADGSQENPALSWASADPSIATVDQAGKVSVIGYGRTAVTASAVISGVTASASCQVYGRSILGHWLLHSDLADSAGSHDGTWKGTYEGSATSPAFTTQDGKDCLHFQYTQDQESTTNPGDWVDCEASTVDPALQTADCVTVSFWIYWDQGLNHSCVDGSEIAIPENPGDGADMMMNIINKGQWGWYGWQLRYEKYTNGYYDGIELWIHHGNPALGSSGNQQDDHPVVDSFENYRNQWVQVAVAIDNVNCRYETYVNGQALAARTYPTPYEAFPAGWVPVNMYTGHFAIGAFSHPWGGFSVNGKMRDVRFYHGLVGPTEMRGVYDSEK